MSPVTVVRPVPDGPAPEQVAAGQARPGAAGSVPASASPVSVDTTPAVPAAAKSPPAPPEPDHDRALADERLQALWRARALRYVLIYLLMGCALVTVRYQTREVYAHLRDTLRPTRTELQRVRSELSLRVQTLTSEQRVRAWALSSGMVPYAQATKQTQAFPAPAVASAPAVSSSAPLTPAPARAPLIVRTVWK